MTIRAYSGQCFHIGYTDTVATCMFGLIHGLVGAEHEGGEVGAVIGIGDCADRGGDRDVDRIAGGVGGTDGELADAEADAFGRCQDLVGVEFGQ